MNPLNLFRKTYTAILPFLSSSINFTKGKGEFLNYNEISLYVNRAVAIRAQKVGEIKFVMTDSKGEQVDRNPFLDALNNPNDFLTGKQFWSLAQTYYDLVGEVYIYVEKNGELFADDKKIKLHLLRPDLVIKNLDSNQVSIVNYTYTSGTTTVTYPRDQIIYWYNPNPKNQLNGVSLLTSGVRSIQTEVELSEYHAKVIKNGGQVDGVFKFKGALSKVQYQEMKEQYKSEHSTAKNAGMPLFLGGDADYIRMGLNPAELSFLESKRATLDDISILTGVPKEILGVTNGATYANADASIAVFLREIIKPRLVELTEVLDWRFIPEEYDLTFVDPTPEDVDRKLKIVETANTTNSATINEKRGMLGLEPLTIKEADEIYIPFNLTPLSYSPTPTEETTKQVKKKSNLEHPFRNVEIRRKYAEVQVKRLDKTVVTFRKVIKEYFDEQKRRIINQLAERKQFKKKDLLGDVFNESLEITLAKNTVLPLLRKYVQEAGIDTFEFLGSDFNFSVTGDIATWVDNRANVFAKEITDTTFKKLGREFTESFDENETRQQLIDRIQGVYDGFDESRATTIARTEVHAAVQKGNLEAFKQAGFTIKIWVWGIGVQGGIREDHQAMDGEEVPINQPFSNGLMFPGDPAGDPAETINCECSV
jgi:HK97 family phage portal protein